MKDTTVSIGEILWEVRMRRAHELAVEVASFVCSCQGAMNRIPAAIVEKFL